MDALTDPPNRDPDTRAAPPRTRRIGRVIAVLLSLMVLGGIAYTVWFWPKPTAEQQAAARRGAGVPIPVLAAEVIRRDTPIYLDGLGTVQAFQNVTVKSMVDGPLIAVNFVEGQMVKKGDVLAQIDPRTYKAALDVATARKAQDEAQLANAKLDLARYQKLVSNNYASAQQADTAKAQVAQFTAMVDQDQGQIDNARTQLDYTTITAPIDGRTGIRQVDVGNIVRSGDATGLVVITQLQPITVVFTLPQQNLRAVSRAMAQGPVEAVAVAQAPFGATAIELDRGTVAVLDNQVDPTTGTIRMKATFPNAESRLWPGGFVGIRLRVRIDKDAVVVPPSAIQRGPRGTYVYVVKDEATVARVQVSVGHEDERDAVVLTGLAGGEKVVVDGASRLTDGSKVSVAMATPVAAEPAAAQGPPGSRRRRGG